MFSATEKQASHPGGSVVKNPPANAGDIRDTGWIPELGTLVGKRK